MIQLKIATYCLGAISNVIISQPVDGFYFVSFRAGTVPACTAEVIIHGKEKSKDWRVVGSFKDSVLANSRYGSTQEVILKIPEIKEIKPCH